MRGFGWRHVMAKRINPDTGVVEEQNDVLGVFEHWDPAENENGNEERVNPETGVVEEKNSVLGIFDEWAPKE
jgi:hypothetical protein